MSSLMILSILLVPVAVHAEGPIEVDSPPETPTESSTLPQTGAAPTPTPTPTTPDTGIAPPSNKVMQHIIVFIAGGVLGAGVGFGILTIRKYRTEK